MQRRLLFVNITYIVFCVGGSYLPILTLVGMPEIDILDVSMGGKMLARLC